MSTEKTSPSASVNAVVIWLESAPDIAKSWLRDDVVTMNALVSQRNQAFQMIGMYDGSMSKECKARFREQYEFLSQVVEWCKSR
jgi:hypothetical protein